MGNVYGSRPCGGRVDVAVHSSESVGCGSMTTSSKNR